MKSWPLEGRVTVDGLAARYDVSRKLIYVWKRGGILPPPTGKMGAWNTWRIADLEEWEERNAWLKPLTPAEHAYLEGELGG